VTAPLPLVAFRTWHKVIHSSSTGMQVTTIFSPHGLPQ